MTSKVIESLGGQAILFPCISIENLSEKAVQLQMSQLESADKIIVVSQHAAKQIRQLNMLRNLLQSWQSQWLSVGEKTADELREMQCTVISPSSDSQTSEGLLSLTECINCQKQTILIVKGEGGRDHLANELSRRGAFVQRLDVYRRIRQPQDVHFQERYVLVERLMQAGKINVALVTSVEVLHSLVELLLPLRHKLVNILLVVPSERVKLAAEKLGFQSVKCAKNASLPAMIEVIYEFL